MKRYLLRGATALVLGGFIAACSHDDIDYSSIVDGKLKAYQEVFVDAYGKINPNQTWGFGTVSVQESTAMARQTRAISVNSDLYNEFNFPSETELANAYPSAVPSGADEVADLETLYKGKKAANGAEMWDLYAIYVNQVTKDYNLKITQPGEYTVGGNYQNIIDGELQCYNIYIDVDGDVTLKRLGATHFNLYILRGNVTLPSDYGEQAGLISVANGARLNDARNSLSANNGIKLFNRGTVIATNTMARNIITEGVTVSSCYDIGNNAKFYNQGTFESKGGLTYSAGAGNTSYFYNRGNNVSLKAPSMTLNSTCHFFTDGTTDITGETAVTQSDIVWVNNGHYTTGSLRFSAKNCTFYNYCQLIVRTNTKFLDGAFNMMEGSYAQMATGMFNNFIVFMHNNSGISITDGSKWGRQGADHMYKYGMQGFKAVDDYAVVYVRLGGQTFVPSHNDGAFHVEGANLTLAYENIKYYNEFKGNFGQASLYSDITYSDETTAEELKEDKDGRITWNIHNVTKFITGDDFARTGFIVKNGECSATWISSDTQYIPIDQSETSDDRSVVETIVEYYETTELIEQGRVFCEDLGQISTNDLDFNDVVFDAYIYKVTPMTRTVVRVDGVLEGEGEMEGESTYKTTIILLAAGGTLPLSIAGSYEVHNVLGGVPVSTIVNTIVDDDGAYHNSWSTHDPVVLGTEFTYRTIEEIPIQVQYGNGETLKLEAITGWAPHKILVPIGTKWCKERVDIATAYTKFKEYVGGEEGFWTDGIESSLLYSHPMDTYRPRSKDPVKKLISVDEPVITKRYKGETITTGGYQEGEEVLSREIR